MRMLLVTLILIISCELKSQVVNIESQRMHTDSLRRGGDLNFDYSYSNVNRRSLSIFNSNLALQQKSKNLKSIFLILGNAEFSKAKNEEFENANFLHLRFNRKLNRFIRWEVFTQAQSNLPIGIKFRYLAGTGPRFKLVNTNHFNLYFGTLYMYEFEKTSDSINNKNSFHRASNYCSFTITFPKLNGEIISTTYYQPRLADFEDYRLFTENRLEFSITKRLKVQTTFNYSFDSRPPDGISRYNTSFCQGLGLIF